MAGLRGDRCTGRMPSLPRIQMKKEGAKLKRQETRHRTTYPSTMAPFRPESAPVCGASGERMGVGVKVGEEIGDLHCMH